MKLGTPFKVSLHTLAQSRELREKPGADPGDDDLPNVGVRDAFRRFGTESRIRALSIRQPNGSDFVLILEPHDVVAACLDAREQQVRLSLVLHRLQFPVCVRPHDHPPETQ